MALFSIIIFILNLIKTNDVIWFGYANNVYTRSSGALFFNISCLKA